MRWRRRAQENGVLEGRQVRLICLFFMLFLVACSSSESSDTTAIQGESPSEDGIRRDVSGPELTEVDWVSDYQGVAENYKVSGEVDTIVPRPMSLSVSSDMMVAIILSSEARDANLYLEDEMGNFELSSESDSSDEFLLLNAKVGVNYFIEVRSETGEGSFELTIVPPSREALGLSNTDVVFYAEGEGVEHCLSEDGVEYDEYHNNEIYQYVYDTQQASLRTLIGTIEQSSIERGVVFARTAEADGWDNNHMVTIYPHQIDETVAPVDPDDSEQEVDASNWFFLGTDVFQAEYNPDQNPMLIKCIGRINFESVFVM